MTDRETDRAAMNAAFESLPEWLREPFTPVRDAVILLLDRGLDETAKGLVEVIQCPTEWNSEQEAMFTQVRASMLSGIDALIAATEAADPLRSPEALEMVALATERRAQ
jgi:hypothetical protein